MSKTSSAVKRKYNSKTYARLEVSVKKEIAEQFKELLEKNNHTASSVFHAAIADYIEKHS